MANPTGWKPTMEKDAKGGGAAEAPGGPGAGLATRGIAHEEPLLFERGSTGRSGVSLPALAPGADPTAAIPAALRRDAVDGLPEISELEAIRHFTRLSTWNYGIDTGLLPARLVHHEVQPEVLGGARAPAGLREPPPARAGGDGAGRARAHVRAASARSPRSPGSTRRRCRPRRARTASSAG